jgi:hypothetical protein
MRRSCVRSEALNAGPCHEPSHSRHEVSSPVRRLVAFAWLRPPTRRGRSACLGRHARLRGERPSAVRQRPGPGAFRSASASRQRRRSTLTDAGFAIKAARGFEPPASGPDLRVLALLQRDGRLVDFLQEDIDSYDDAQIGAAVRDIHRGCRKALRDYLVLEPVMDAGEDADVTIPKDFDPGAIRLTGNVAGAPPFHGVLRHHGWRVASLNLPMLPGDAKSASVLAPAEVEVR